MSILYQNQKFSILEPDNCTAKYNSLSDEACHDLGLDLIVKAITTKESEQNLIKKIMRTVTADPAVSNYRIEVFEDVLRLPKMREEMLTLLDKVKFLEDYGSLKKEYEDTANAWDLLHRLSEIGDYIDCVESIHGCLEKADLSSEGLKNVKKHVDAIYEDHAFGELKKDIEGLRADTSSLKSVPLGVNLNSHYEADGVGVVSFNSKAFTKSNILSDFGAKLKSKDGLYDEADWSGSYAMHPLKADTVSFDPGLQGIEAMALARMAPGLVPTVAGIAEGDPSGDVTKYMDHAANALISTIVKRLRTVLNKYVSVTIRDITALIPEFTYYVRWAEYLEKVTTQGYRFSKPVASDKKGYMKAEGIYNLKLVFTKTEEAGNIVTNDLDFDDDKRIYILTGANRGGKTTITQAIGILYVLAQGGIHIPGEGFEFAPVDNIFTHFPADEDKTMDLGRLGEECKRFKDIYEASSSDSLILLNETFSTTSFEEGYYIAEDSIKAMLKKDVRCIYNTHMHKLAYELDEMNAFATCGKAVSLIVEAKDGKRSFKVKIAPPEGMSYAKDIAEKYGVTYSQLTQ